MLSVPIAGEKWFHVNLITVYFGDVNHIPDAEELEIIWAEVKPNARLIMRKRKKMSLTRDEWIQLWKSVKAMEAISEELQTSYSKNTIKYGIVIRMEVNKMKKQIESVIGQQE